MPEHEFPLVRIFPYKDRTFGFVFIWENTGQRKPIFWQFFSSVLDSIGSFSDLVHLLGTVRKMKFSINDFSSKRDQIGSFC